MGWQTDLTMGVEEEFILLDAAGHSTAAAEAVLRLAARTEFPPGCMAKRELHSTQVELASGVCADAQSLHAQLTAGRRALANCAASSGVRLVSTGMPPSTVGGSEPPRPIPRAGDRFDKIHRLYGGIVSGYEANGCHVHVGVPDQTMATKVINFSRVWLPTLLALSVNSPFHEGEDSGYGSWRMIEQSRFPGAGIPPPFATAADYNATVDHQIKMGVIVDNRMSFWLARPSPKVPTVEFRIADAAPTVGEAVLQAVLSRALVATALRSVEEGREPPPMDSHTAAAAVWTAARYGLEGNGIDPTSFCPRPATDILDDLLQHLHAALRAAGDWAWVVAAINDLRKQGTGATRQRLAHTHGIDELTKFLEKQTSLVWPPWLTSLQAERSKPVVTVSITTHHDHTAERLPAATMPSPRGPLSESVHAALAGTAPFRTPPATVVVDADPFGDDLQLALHLCYELHYQGFKGVDDAWEWDPELLRFRGRLEERFLTAARTEVPGGDDVVAALDPLLAEPVDEPGVSHFLRDEGTWQQVREYFVHRSIYHLKEADPHAWVIPRLSGHTKAAIVAVEYDEFGGGSGDRMHSRLYADLLAAARLESSYLYYLDAVPAPAIAIVNMMSMFGLHRSLRGALIGHFAAAEITTAPSAQRMDDALGRLGAAESCRHFYTEHVEADAVHEQVLRHDVVGTLLDHEPHLASDVVFGIQVTDLLEKHLSNHLLTAWRTGTNSLRHPLPPE